jgi:hypothetical protein
MITNSEIKNLCKIENDIISVIFQDIYSIAEARCRREFKELDNSALSGILYEHRIVKTAKNIIDRIRELYPLFVEVNLSTLNKQLVISFVRK